MLTFATIYRQKNCLERFTRQTGLCVTFWATDCPGCIKEIPDLIDLYTQYHKQGLEIIAVAMYYDPPNHVVTMTEEQRLPYDVAAGTYRAETRQAFGECAIDIPSF